MLEQLEKQIGNLLSGLPQMPENARKTLAQWWPVLGLIAGILQILGALSLWRLSRSLSGWADYANQLSRSYGLGSTVPDLSIFYWLGLLSLAASGVIMLIAYSHLKAKRKQGWDLLFLSAVINLAYGIFMLFVDNYYGGVDTLIGTLISSTIGFYLLFQVKDQFTHKTPHTETKP